MPRRSLIGLSMLSAATLTYFVMDWDLGRKYQGLPYVITLAFFNLLALITCWWLLIRARRRHTFESTLLAHAATVVWLMWIAFPWLGELP